MKLPQAFRERMQAVLGEEYAAFEQSYSLPAARAVRVNTLKLSAQKFKELAPFNLVPVPWCEDGFYIEEPKPGNFIFHDAGLYYVQEPSAMCAAPLLGDVRNLAVLDMCSAPGGKGTQIAQAMGGTGVLFLNEINFSRAKALSQNVERLGIGNAIVTVASPNSLAAEFPACFDKILVDAPCSGEGMFKKEAAAIAEWSPANVEMSARRQAEILNSADILLKAGGTLVYSTCTFSEEEDERQVQAFLETHKNYTLKECKKLLPHRERGEGHFAALLQKSGGEEGAFTAPRPQKIPQEGLYREFEAKYLAVTFKNLCLVGDTLYSLPQGAPHTAVQTLRAGVRLGTFVKGRFEPAHALAMYLKEGQATFLPLTQRQAADFFAGMPIDCPQSYSGWCVAAYGGYPLGWCKASGGTAKNHYPKGLRKSGLQ